MVERQRLNHTQTASLRLKDVSISLGNKILLSVNTDVNPGEILTVMGPSGSGKSSLLAYIAGFLDSAFTATGEVIFAEKNLIALPPESRRVGLLFQDALLFPHMSVYQNLAFAIPQSQAASKTARLEMVKDALASAGLEGLENRDPETLSGGQKSRIALLRVLLAAPRALLLDEPFSKLDADLRQQMREFVFSEAKKRQLPVLLVTHDYEDAKAAGGEIIRLVE
jgi:putative thiamine transport system ATP-binding protein